MKNLNGANIDIDLTSEKNIEWQQDKCPWNTKENTNKHKCAIKNTSICDYFCGLDYPDVVKCCWPNKNPLEN